MEAMFKLAEHHREGRAGLPLNFGRVSSGGTCHASHNLSSALSTLLT
jgi:hypothetical protein